MTLTVIGAGFGRTGTSSLQQALVDLGFGPCYHMTELLAHPDHVAVWGAALDGKPVDWEYILRDYQSAVDWPPAAFYEQLMERYPAARVILTVRDPQRWYDSALNTIYAISRLTGSPPISWLLPWVGPRQHRVGTMISRMIWDEIFDGRFADRQHAIDVFTRYNEDVQRRVPADRLLVFDVKQGWEPLCAFLHVPVPAGKPFPHLNDTARFRRMIRAIRTIAYGLPLVVAALVALVMWRVRRPR